MWRVGWLVFFFAGCFPQTDRAPDSDWTRCTRSLGAVAPSCQDAICRAPLSQHVPGSHRRRVTSGDWAYDFGLFSRTSLTAPQLQFGDYPRLADFAFAGAVPWLNTAAGSGKIVHLWDAYPRSSPDGHILREDFDPDAGTSRLRVFAQRDAGGYSPGAALVMPDGTLTVLGQSYPPRAFNGVEPRPSALFTELPDGGLVVREFPPRHRYLGRDLLEVSDGFIGHLVMSSDARDAFLRLRADGGFSDGDFLEVDAGTCVLDRDAEVTDDASGWCVDPERRRVLRWERLFERVAPSVVFEGETELQLVGFVEGRLVVATNVRALESAGQRGDVGWLDANGFHLISADRVLPVGYGPWTPTTAAFTFMQADGDTLAGFELVEAPYRCP